MVLTPTRTLRIMQYHDIVIDLLWQRLNWQGKIIDLSPQETRLFVALVDRAGEVCDRDYLAQQVLGVPRYNYQNSTNIEVYMSYLRQKLHRLTGDKTFITTVTGEGYRLRR